jgi:hypothetical protein
MACCYSEGRVGRARHHIAPALESPALGRRRLGSTGGPWPPTPRCKHPLRGASTPKNRRTMSNGRRAVHAVLESDEFNALLKRLPRAIRRTADPASPGEIGLIVEIVSAEDSRLTTVFARVSRASDVTRELARLEARARRELA